MMQINWTKMVWLPAMVVAVSVSTTAVRSRTASTCASPSDVGAVAPVQNLSLSVVGDGLSVPARAELIFTLNVDTPEVAVAITRSSIVTVPPERPLMVIVKPASLSVVAKEPANPPLTAAA